MAKKGQMQRKYSTEFKISVIMDMREHRYGYRETARKYELGESGMRKGRYGYRRVLSLLRAKGYSLNHKTVLKLMRNLGLKGKQRKNDKFAKLPNDATPLFHSDQGWQHQHAEYQRLLAEHNIKQSMSRKGNCRDNGAMENFFGRLKVEMFYGEKFESVNAFIDELKNYINYYNNERISLKLKGMSPVQYRAHSQIT